MSDLNDISREACWYVVHTYSGYENKVKANLEKIVENRGLQHLIFDSIIPVETVKDGEEEDSKEVENKIFPSYVLIKMIMSDESWHVVRNIRGVTGFVGPGSKPVPLTDEEVASTSSIFTSRMHSLTALSLQQVRAKVRLKQSLSSIMTTQTEKSSLPLNPTLHPSAVLTSSQTPKISRL